MMSGLKYNLKVQILFFKILKPMNGGRATTTTGEEEQRRSKDSNPDLSISNNAHEPSGNIQSVR